VLVATSDRDSFQLASERVTILQPTRGVSELARIGPAEVRERYGVEPEQVPDLIALRGDPSDKLPGARGIGPKKAASCSSSTARSRPRSPTDASRGGGGLEALPANRP
jgi:DNA polymerase-1